MNQPLPGSVASQFLPAPGDCGPKEMSKLPSAFCTGVSILLIDGKGWPLSRPAPVIGSYTVTDQKMATGTSLGTCSVSSSSPRRKSPSASLIEGWRLPEPHERDQHPSEAWDDMIPLGPDATRPPHQAGEQPHLDRSHQRKKRA